MGRYCTDEKRKCYDENVSHSKKLLEIKKFASRNFLKLKRAFAR